MQLQKLVQIGIEFRTTFMDYNKENRTASFYHQWYLRTGPTAGLMAAAIVTGVAAAAVFGAVAAIA